MILHRLWQTLSVAVLGLLMISQPIFAQPNNTVVQAITDILQDKIEEKGEDMRKTYITLLQTVKDKNPHKTHLVDILDAVISNLQKTTTHHPQGGRSISHPQDRDITVQESVPVRDQSGQTITIVKEGYTIQIYAFRHDQCGSTSLIDQEHLTPLTINGQDMYRSTQSYDGIAPEYSMIDFWDPDGQGCLNTDDNMFMIQYQLPLSQEAFARGTYKMSYLQTMDDIVQSLHR